MLEIARLHFVPLTMTINIAVIPTAAQRSGGNSFASNLLVDEIARLHFVPLTMTVHIVVIPTAAQRSGGISFANSLLEIARLHFVPLTMTVHIVVIPTAAQRSGGNSFANSLLVLEIARLHFVPLTMTSSRFAHNDGLQPAAINHRRHSDRSAAERRNLFLRATCWCWRLLGFARNDIVNVPLAMTVCDHSPLTIDY
ncbi:hypothetical protein [Niabella ginsengisoli]|uniref:Secreted protein n=1 Tax=Niabella ginsengisoli TaxID=522298 RepID=A0ABS9SFG8_9BACT|nr:hypothetical protein [Niabella ginsengisoli]MCH5597066.1 hypothetical protein [Niabella ginsengisoli]